MAAVLTWPVGRADDSENRPPPFAPVAAYVLASVAGGAAVGFAIAQAAVAIGGISGFADAALTLLAGAAVLAAAVLQWKGRLRPLPERRAQVPRHWLLWPRRTLAAAAFGLMIGSGVLTHLKHAAAYALAALIVVAPSVEAGTLVGAAYGLSRGMVLATTWLGDRFVGRRPGWPGAGESSRALNRALASAGLASFAVALFLIY